MKIFVAVIVMMVSAPALACVTSEQMTSECQELIKRLGDFKQQTQGLYVHSYEFKRAAEKFSQENGTLIQAALKQANKDKDFAIQQLHNFGRLSPSTQTSIFKKVAALVDDAVKKVNTHADFFEKEMGGIITGETYKPKSIFGLSINEIPKVEKMTLPEINYFLYSDMDDTSRLVQYSEETSKLAAEYVKKVDADTLATREAIERADRLRKLLNLSPKNLAGDVAKQIATGAARAAK